MGQRAKSIAESVAKEAAALFGAAVATEPVSQCDSDTPALSGKTFALSPAAEAALSQCDSDTLDPRPAVMPDSLWDCPPLGQDQTELLIQSGSDSDTPDPIAVEVDRQAQRPLLAVTQAARMQECERLAKHILTRFGSEKPDILEVARQLRNWRYGGR
jgi:hypothetical protein